MEKRSLFPQRMLIIAGLVFIFLLWVALDARSASHSGTPLMSGDVLDNPATVILSPGGARVEVVANADIARSGAHDTLEFVIPSNAANLQLAVPHRTIVRWSSSPVILKGSGGHSTRRGELEKEQMELGARLVTVKARLDVWKGLSERANAQDLEQRQNMMKNEMPALALEKEELEKRLALVREELSDFPDFSGVGSRITVFLASAEGKDDKKAAIEYSYDLPTCGWRAIYEFNANPDESRDSVIDVRLLAEVWQYSGADWKDAKIILATSGHGPREPQPLRHWVIGNAAPAPQPKAIARSVAKGAAATMALEHANDVAAAPPVAPVSGDNNGMYATWTLSERGLPEGRSRLQISAHAWEAPMQWLARPTVNDNRVWLMAKYNLPADQAWPEGYAQYSINGQNVGDGDFAPHGGEATLYFGPDPRVTVRTIIDSHKQGETGFINTSKTWTWGWTYTISNLHPKAVKVRVERPAPMLENDNMTATYKNKPEAKEDAKEHMFYWNVDVPANGKTSIEHMVTISSPEKLPLLPDVP